jgi:hypothetical protein
VFDFLYLLQVCCNALLPSVFSVIYGFLVGCVDVPLGPLPSLESWRCQAATALMGAFLVRVRIVKHTHTLNVQICIR